MGSAFTQCSLLFTAEGVLQLVKNQATSDLGTKDVSKTFGALQDYGVEDIYCRSSSLQRYGLTSRDLLLDPIIIDDNKTQALIREHDQVLTF